MRKLKADQILFRGEKMINKNIAFVSKKMMRLILLLLGVSILSFLLLKYSPVDPVMASITNIK